MFFYVCISFEELIDYLWLNYKLCTFITRFSLLFFRFFPIFLKATLCILKCTLDCRSEIPHNNYRKFLNPISLVQLVIWLFQLIQSLTTGGRYFVDIIGDISWKKGVTFRGHFWWHFVDKNVHEMSSFWVTFRGHFLGDISWTFFGWIYK